MDIFSHLVSRSQACCYFQDFVSHITNYNFHFTVLFNILVSNAPMNAQFQGEMIIELMGRQFLFSDRFLNCTVYAVGSLCNYTKVDPALQNATLESFKEQHTRSVSKMVLK